MEETRKIGDYSVKYSMYIGHKDIALGENPNAEKNERYMCCFVETNAIFERYSGVLVSDDFAEIAKVFGQRVADAAEEIIQENERACQEVGINEELMAESCSPVSYKDSIENKVVVVKGSIPLWAVTLIGGLFIWVLSFVMILSVYGRFFKMYMYTALAPVPLSAFAGEPTQNIGKSFLKSYASVCLEGAIIVLACIIFSVFASSPPVVDPNAAPASMVWSYIGELIFNMLILVGAVKMADRLVKEMMGI